jgi:putative nucleotidyltransferase with HDIG domain
MVEAGAKAVGAYSLLAKVAALYHDIGKISKAAYIIENQNPEENPHNRLAPSMSALILISHVKQGVELAAQGHLGREVLDIIRQHHGTSRIQYFYQKALQQTDAVPPKEEDFCYPGPRPQSNEAALIMLADASEASSRTLEDPTPHRLRQHISTIIKAIYATGQLDETELTFRDLDKLADTFSSVLRGIFHHRVSYPDKGARDKADASKTVPAEELPPALFRPWPAALPADAAQEKPASPILPEPPPAGSAPSARPSGNENRSGGDTGAFPPVSTLPQ